MNTEIETDREIKMYAVEHCKGVAGVNEEVVEAVEIEAYTEAAAILLSGFTPDITDAPNESGRYCDYVYAYEIYRL